MAIGIQTQDAYRKELTLSLNAYNKPLEVKNVEAWSRLIIQIAYMKPGTMPSNPRIGCDFGKYTYVDTSVLQQSLAGELETQINEFYPSIPLDSITFDTITTPNNTKAGVFVFKFIDVMMGNIIVASAATGITSKGLLDIKIEF